MPERGAIRVEFGAAQADGVTGVIAAVVGLFTGVAGEGGFKGLGDRFCCQNLLQFAVGNGAGPRFTRLDSGASVAVSYHPGRVPPSSELQALMQKLLLGEADTEERAEFGSL